MSRLGRLAPSTGSVGRLARKAHVRLGRNTFHKSTDRDMAGESPGKPMGSSQGTVGRPRETEGGQGNSGREARGTQGGPGELQITEFHCEVDLLS